MKRLLLFIFTFSATLSFSQNKIQSSIEESYNGTSWVNSEGVNYEYDTNNNLISETFYTWDSSNWNKFLKITYTYNADHKVTESVDSFWDEDSNQFVVSFRSLYTYNTNGNLTNILEQDYTGTQWTDEYLTLITYNNGLHKTITYSEWNGTEWIDEDRGTTTYSSNKLLQVEYQDWIGNQWITDNRDIFNYNAKNEMINYIYEKRDGNNWTEEGRTTYALDTNGNRINEIEIYSGSNQYKTEYSYDTNILLSNLTHPFKDKTGVDYLYEDFPYVNKLLNTTEFNYNNSYALSRRTTFNYNASLTLGINNFELSNLKVYPNPAKNHVNISSKTKIESVEIIDVTGKLISKIESPKNTIDVSKLSKGMYIVRLYSENEAISKRIIKQ